MAKDRTKGISIMKNEDLIKSLLDDPTKSTLELAKELKSNRQTIWRNKKKMEDEKIIWGYTAVIDENKLNNIIYLVLMKMKPMTRGMVDITLKRLFNGEQLKHNVRLIDAFHVNGEYDWIIRFSAKDHTTARKYYDTLRVIYEEYLLEKPMIVDINFILIAEGKKNPETDKMYDFVPLI
jgi:DNA-binding Lrp family transcriptional regulator